MHREDNKRTGLLSYIKGNVKGRAAHDLEREAMQDPFLADALDGYGNVEDPELDIRLHRMEEAIKRQDKPARRKGRGYAFPIFAAAVLLVACILSFELGILRGEKHNALIAMNDIEPVTLSMPQAAVTDMDGYESEPFDISGPSSAANGRKPVATEAKEPVAAYSRERAAQSKAETAEQAERSRTSGTGGMGKTGGTEQAGQNSRKQPETSRTGRTEQPERNRSGHDVTEAAVQVNASQAAGSGMIKEDILEMAEEEITEIAEQEQAGRAISEDRHFAGAEPVHQAAACKMQSTAAAGPENNGANRDMSPRPTAGYRSYYEYIYDRLGLTADADSLNGIVVLSFIVDKEGQPDDFMIIESSSRQMAERIIGIIRDGGKWTGSGPVSSFTVVY